MTNGRWITYQCLHLYRHEMRPYGRERLVEGKPFQQ
jgi:hypothetical protein